MAVTIMKVHIVSYYCLFACEVLKAFALMMSLVALVERKKERVMPTKYVISETLDSKTLRSI